MKFKRCHGRDGAPPLRFGDLGAAPPEVAKLARAMQTAPRQPGRLMWKIYEDVAQELKLSEPWNWEKEVGGAQPKNVVRGVLESGGLKHVFSSTYDIRKVTAPAGPGGGGPKVDTLRITPLDEGWKKV